MQSDYLTHGGKFVLLLIIVGKLLGLFVILGLEFLMLVKTNGIFYTALVTLGLPSPMLSDVAIVKDLIRLFTWTQIDFESASVANLEAFGLALVTVFGLSVFFNSLFRVFDDFGSDNKGKFTNRVILLFSCLVYLPIHFYGQSIEFLINYGVFEEGIDGAIVGVLNNPTVYIIGLVLINLGLVLAKRSLVTSIKDLFE